MKSPKPLLDFGGTPLLALLLEECRQSLVDSIIVVLGHDREKISENIDLAGITTVINPDYQKGQTSSLQCALRALDPETEAFVNLPVDHPLVTRKEIDALVTAYRRRNGEAKIFLPLYAQQEGRPVLFDSSLRDEILVLSADEPARSVIERFRKYVCHVPVDNPYTMKDMDTPQDYRECLQLFHSLRKAS